ncbi:MAG: HD domain-containing protein [Egibacteraceae bacterium]
MSPPLRDCLERRYSAPGRHYHNLEHLRQVLAEVQRLLGDVDVEDPDAVRLAAWFHDAVYDPGAEDNEERSATLADQLLAEEGMARARRLAVSRLVLCTREHRASRADEAVLCDADLAVLASPPEAYERYRLAVRAEHAWLSESDWRAGRGAVLSELHARRPLYATPAARAEWEDAAHRNLAAELATLADG